MSQILSAEIQELKKRQQFVLYKVTLLCLVNNNVQLQCVRLLLFRFIQIMDQNIGLNIGYI